MKEKIKRLLKSIVIILVSIVASSIVTLVTLKGLAGFIPEDMCSLQTEEGRCLTLFSFAPASLQTIIGGIFFVLVAIGIYRSIKEQF